MACTIAADLPIVDSSCNSMDVQYAYPCAFLSLLFHLICPEGGENKNVGVDPSEITTYPSFTLENIDGQQKADPLPGTITDNFTCVIDRIKNLSLCVEGNIMNLV